MGWICAYEMQVNEHTTIDAKASTCGIVLPKDQNY
jgi:hypothetical protein